ncbi:hypothetical protein BJX76DRAFT_360201 [Aspergillus varians]
MDSYAHQACVRCRKQKRKCNRLLPVCSRCTKLKLRCRYHALPEDPGSPECRDLTALGHALQSQVCSVIGDTEAVAQSAAAYFSSIHRWFPTVNRDVYYRGLGGRGGGGGGGGGGGLAELPPEFSLLTLSMYLVCLPAGYHGLSRRVNALYILVAGFVASLTAAGVNSLDLLHSRLLLSLFEVGHGMYPAAYISMGASVRAAVALGVDRSDGLGGRFGQAVDEADDARRLWLGLVILDRYVSLEMDRSSMQETTSHTPAMSPSTQLNDLYRASTLLARVLAHIVDPTPYEQKSAEAIPILEALAAFRDVTQGSDSQGPRPCPTTALCSSAFMTILEFGYRFNHPVGKDCSPLSFALLEAEVLQFVTDCEAWMGVVADSAENVDIPVFFIHAVGKAAVIVLRCLGNSPAVDVPASVDCLKGLLDRVKGRWRAAGVYLDKIQQEEAVLQR